MKCVVLLSSGLDSTVNLYKVFQDHKVELVITFDYGQKSAAQEIKHSKKTTQHLGVKHKIIDLTWFKDFTSTSLINPSHNVPVDEAVSINDLEASKESSKSVWVPNRNGIFLNIAAGFAEGLGAEAVVPGFNLEEAATFDDNSKAYIDSLEASFRYSTRNNTKVVCFTDQLYKNEIVKLGKSLNVKFNYIWSCYLGGESPCGQCESCKRYKRAIDSK